MDQCCQSNAEALAAVRKSRGRVLRAVLGVNLGMFGIESVAGVLSGSSALLGDSLDMLGDSMVYGFSLYVLHRGAVWRVRAALAKGAVMVAFGIGVLVDAGIKLSAGAPPAVPVMLGVGSLALAANTFCFSLLWRHRSDDINLRSTWLCSRNDLVANGAVLASAVFVAAFQSGLPDIIVGIGIASLFLRTASSVFRDALAELGRVQSGAVGNTG